MSWIEPFAREFDRGVAQIPDASRRARQRHRLIESAVSPPAAPRRFARWVAMLATSAATAGVVVSWAPWEVSSQAERSASHPTFVAQAWLQAPDDEVLRFRLRGGGHVELAPASRARVLEASRGRLHLALEGGSLRVLLGEANDGEWDTLSIDAGPLTLTSHVARFQLAWDAEARRVELAVDGGELNVSGGQLGVAGLVVEAGKELHAGPEGVQISESGALPGVARSGDGASASAARPEVAAAPNAKRVRVSSRTARRGAMRATARVDAVAVEPRWRELAGHGEYKAALAEAERVGFPQLLAHSSATDLKQLADAARLARDGARAKDALLALRRRFTASKQARLAAFLIGRVSFDLQSDYREAAHWFKRYVRESPNGALRLEAEGRVIDALRRSGQKAEAKAAARTYMTRQPSGAYADLARSLVDGK